jgi:hypothetical protein
MDYTGWLVQATGIPLWLIKNKWACLIADVCFYGLPIIHYFIYKLNLRLSVAVATLMVVVNFTYILSYCSFPTDSLHGYIVYFLFPFLFLASSLHTFWFLFQGLRYFFLFFFASAGLWKLIQGGVFHMEVMSSILLNQHKEMLVGNEGIMAIYWWLIEHPKVSYFLYFIGTVMELSFIAGFFTKRFDTVLVILYTLFLIMNLLIMRINYWQTFPFIVVLIYSKVQPGHSKLKQGSFQPKV